MKALLKTANLMKRKKEMIKNNRPELKGNLPQEIKSQNKKISPKTTKVDYGKILNKKDMPSSREYKVIK